MAELKDRFALADEIETVDLWTEARRRAAAPEAPPRAVEWPPGASRRLAVGALAFAVFAAAVLFAWDLAHPDRRPAPDPRPAPPAVDVATEFGPGWTELPAPPEVRSGSAATWTGSQLLVSGGYVFEGSGDKTPRSGGFAFDAASWTWSSISPSPLEARALSATAWTGSELLVWGGWDGGTGLFDDGAAYDPLTDRWRTMPDSPLEARSPLSVWTGEEMVVWGTQVRLRAVAMDGAAYDPISNTWRRIAAAPIRLTDATAAWTGEEMIVFGAALDFNNHADTPTAIGAAYDPSKDTWRELPPSDLSPQANTAAWPGSGEVIAWDYEHATAAYDPAADTWRELPRVPLDFAECGPVSASIPDHVFGNYCGALVLYRVADDAWRNIGRDDLRGWVIEPVAAGNAFLVMAHSLELSAEPGVTFDSRMLGYVPPARDTAEGSSPAPFMPRTETVGDETRMPVVFPNGSRATLVFPGELGLEELGVQPNVSYLWKEYPPPRFPIVFLHNPNASIATYVEGTEPVGTTGDDESVEVWEMSDEWQDRRRLFQGHWLRYHLASWTVLVALERSEEAGTVAANMVITETSGSFPVVVASGPIALSHESGEGEGPMLAIGLTLDPSVLLSIERCSGRAGIDEVLDSGAYGSACLANGRISATIYGNASTVEAIAQGLRINDFRSP